MTPTREFSLIGRGVYTLAEAARLTKVPARRVRRWAQGYWYIYRGERRFSPAVVGTGIEPQGKSPILQFRDLIEIRFLEEFRRYGVHWKVLRLAATKAQKLLQQSHPFATRIFRTDGRTILAELMSPGIEDYRLMDLISDQLEWEQFVRPFLHEAGIEFNDMDQPERWRPIGFEQQIVIDPMRAFGAPIVDRGGVPTFVLAKAVAVEGDAELVATWYDVSNHAVHAAMKFEAELHRAA